MHLFHKKRSEISLQLKNIRIAYFFQNLCIITLLIYYGIKIGWANVTQKNSLWLIWIVTGVLFSYLQMGICVDMESEKIEL
jgi:hypothetical protein